MEYILSCGCVNTTMWIHHRDADKTLREKDGNCRRMLLCYIEQIMETIPQEITAVQPVTHHSYNHLRGTFIMFPYFFVQAFKFVVNSCNFSKSLLYILWDDKPIFMISGSNEQLQQQLEYTLLKPDWHSWWTSKMQSRCEDALEERYATKFCFKLWKKATETYGMLQTAFRPPCMNRASVLQWDKRFKEGRASVRDD